MLGRLFHLPCLLILLVPACRDGAFPVAIEDQALVLRDDAGETVVFSAVQPSRAASAAGVRRAHTLVFGPHRRIAAAVVSRNRQHYLLPLRPAGTGRVSFGDAMRVPAGTELTFRPDGRALLVLSRHDLYLPPTSTFRLNRGAMLLRPDELSWHDSAESALAAEVGTGTWYGAPEARFVPEMDFAVEKILWEGAGCVLHARLSDGHRRVVELR